MGEKLRMPSLSYFCYVLIKQEQKVLKTSASRANFMFSKYQASEISDLRNIWSHKYPVSEILGLKNIGSQKYRVSEI